MTIKVYDASNDEMIEATQEWCDTQTKAINGLALQRELARKILEINIKDDFQKLIKIKETLGY